MDADGRVACGDTGFASKGLERASGYVYFAEDFVVGGLELAKDVIDALAYDRFSLRVRLALDSQILCPAIQCAIFDSAMAVVVDDGVAQDAVEPCDCGLTATQTGRLFNRAGVGALDDVFGDLIGGDAATHELQKLISLGGEVGDGVGLHGVF